MLASFPRNQAGVDDAQNDLGLAVIQREAARMHGIGNLRRELAAQAAVDRSGELRGADVRCIGAGAERGTLGGKRASQQTECREEKAEPFYVETDGWEVRPIRSEHRQGEAAD